MYFSITCTVCHPLLCACVDKNTVVISASTVKFYICSADERFYDSDDSDYMSPSSVDSGDM